MLSVLLGPTTFGSPADCTAKVVIALSVRGIPLLFFDAALEDSQSALERIAAIFWATRLGLLVLFLLPFDAQQAHKLIEHKVESALIARVHEIVNFSPALTIVDVSGEDLHGPIVGDLELPTTLQPWSVLQIAEHWH